MATLTMHSSISKILRPCVTQQQELFSIRRLCRAAGSFPKLQNFGTLLKHAPSSIVLSPARLSWFRPFRICASESRAGLRVGLDLAPWVSMGKEAQEVGTSEDGTAGVGNAAIGAETVMELSREHLVERKVSHSDDGGSEGLPQWAAARTQCTPPKLLTLVIIHKDSKVLLGMKKRGFGKGYYNGFGGKVEKGETIDEAAARELQEEAGVKPVDMSRRGTLTFHFDNDPIPWEFFHSHYEGLTCNASNFLEGEVLQEILELAAKVHVYHVSDIVGDPYETEEMAPKWFNVSEIPYETMWADDILWYPAFLEGRRFQGNFYFDDTTTLVSHSFHIN